MISNKNYIIYNIFKNVLLISIYLITTITYATDNRTAIAIIDSGINLKAYPELQPFLCKTGHINIAGDTLHDNCKHGTNVTWLITRGLDVRRYCVVIIKYCDSCSHHPNNIDNLLKAYQYILLNPTNLNIRYINLSINGKVYNSLEEILIAFLLVKKIHIVVAAGNDGANLDKKCVYYPACLITRETVKIWPQYFHIVGSCNSNKRMHIFSNFGSIVKHCENGYYEGPPGLELTGTSQAAAIFMNKLIKSHSQINKKPKK